MSLQFHCIVFVVLVILCLSCNEKKEEQQPINSIKELFAPSEDEILTDQAKKSTSSGVHKIDIKGMKFVPEQIFVNMGDTIVWINKDVFAHDVTEFTTKKWGSSKLEPAMSWAKIIKEDDEYYCSLHVVMKGKIFLKNNRSANK